MATKVMNGLDLQAQRIQNISDPSVSTDAASKNYVDNVVQGLSWKPAARVASTGNVTVSSPGATVDSVTLATNDRVLLKSQTTGAENGIYVFNGSASALTRATDGDDGTELSAGAAYYITEGTVNKDTSWVQTTTGTITIGTTATVWTQFGGGTTYTAGNGISISSNTITAVGTTGITVGGSGIGVDFNTVPKKFNAVLSGSSTSYTVTHSLGSRNVAVTIYDGTSFNVVWADVAVTTTNTITVSFAVAPTAGQYTASVIG